MITLSRLMNLILKVSMLQSRKACFVANMKAESQVLEHNGHA
jgi:hypothetical protein